MYQLTKFFFAASLPSSYAETPGLLNSVSSRISTAASAIASAFTAGTLHEENEPPPSPSNRLSATDVPSHAGNSGEEANLSAPNRPIRRKNFAITDSVDV
ncbi:hypothetical protein ARMGADRAFT_1018881 [Armillaria gallica]|uniref:Uncharacterized protein n=1 Tax=Armillaria gallica TaxID=47427 RepID=A0A2H3D936_ARMGA|nr:hypothetical protein ARMGADRAFT_1018881 [Armillaria gallica]